MHEIAAMPQSNSDFLWWAFQAVFLALVWFMKRDLSEIKADIRADRQLSEATAAKQDKHQGVCEERHRRLDMEIVEIKESMK